MKLQYEGSLGLTDTAAAAAAAALPADAAVVGPAAAPAASQAAACASWPAWQLLDQLPLAPQPTNSQLRHLPFEQLKRRAGRR